MFKLIHRFRSSFRIKLFSIFILFTLILTSIVGIFLYIKFSETLKNEVSASIQNSLQSTAYNFDSILLDVQNNISTLSLDSEITEGISKKESFFTYDYLVTSNLLKNKLGYFKSNQNVIKSNYLISSDFQYFYRTNMSRTFTKEELMTTSWFSGIESGNFYQWMRFAPDSVTDTVPGPMLSYIVPVGNYLMGNCVGYLITNIDYDFINSFFRDLKFGETGEIFVYTADKHLIYHPDYAMILDDCMMENELPTATSVTYTRDNMNISFQSGSTGFIYAVHVPMKEIMKPAYDFRKLLYLILFICFGLSVFFSLIISNTVFYPLHLLTKHMNLLGSGSANPQIKVTRTDEFGEIFGHFNQMSSQINTLINEVLTQKLLTRELQLKNLQNQIDPHFLYNTLDSIHWAARENDQEAVCNMIFLLSDHYRKSLSYGEEFLSVQEINDLIQNYMELWAYRLLDKFSYSIETDDSLLSVRLSKQIFLPLVENALIHGIEKSTKKCFCHITWKKYDDYIQFSVSDNGVGIPKEKLNELQNILSEENSFPSNENFALKNINLQLQIRYHTKLELISEPGKETTVFFKIPAANLPSKEE